MYLITALGISIVIMILAIAHWKIHPFLAIMGTSFLLALAVGLPLKTIPETIGTGFGKTFGNIALVIIFGALIGSILEATGGAAKLAEMVIRCIGKQHPALAMGLMGWIVSIPVFCDSGFVILDPVRKNLCKQTRCSSVTLTVALAAGLFVSHVFIPPTPGPVAAAESLGLGNHLLYVIILGMIVSIPSLFAAILFAKYIGRKIHSSEETPAEEVNKSLNQDDLLLHTFVRLPNGILSMIPILVPLIFLALGSFASLLHLSETWKTLFLFFGNPIIALGTGFICSIPLLIQSGKSAIFPELSGNTLKLVGPILFITAAGGVLGNIIASTGLVDMLKEHISDFPQIGLFFPFLFAAFLKTAQGSSTVAITTTAGILGNYTDPSSMVNALGFTTPLEASLVVMAIGAGGLTVSHANDSYFWIVTNFGGISSQDGYRTHTAMTLIMGVVSIISLWLISLFI